LIASRISPKKTRTRLPDPRGFFVNLPPLGALAMLGLYLELEKFMGKLGFLFRLVSAVSLAFALVSGCALLNPRGDSASESDDPVADAAERLREEKMGPSLSNDDVERIEHAKIADDLTTGMHAGDVMGAWGAPLRVEATPGAPSGNERWLYKDGLSRFRGVQATRVIYFENHRVVGWETSNN
jgi:hypothetical protein